ncbi:MAG: histidine ammonia-lyase [Rhodobacteraceae bacterium]|nr:histidine ammonia-lyase [Paracoccaceae bacterium]
MTRNIPLGATPLSLDDLIDVTRNAANLELGQTTRDSMRVSEDWVAGFSARMDSGEKTEAVYSINTGFGSLSGRQAFTSSAQARDLSRRLVISNAAGVGRELDAEVVRAAMVIRAASLTRGYSAVRAVVVDTILAMLEKGVTPWVPEYGSLGASGDLIPLAHMALVMSRDEADDIEIDSGKAWFNGKLMTGMAAMKAAGIERIVLGPKEGLALLNGTSFSTAQTALALADAENLVASAEVAAAMSIEALMGFGDAFIPELHQARGHQGQIECAANIRALLQGSGLIDGGIGVDPKRQPPQDAYSLRCVPQVLGPVRDTLKFIRGVVETEINAATDNPLIFADKLPGRNLKAISGGNFHAEYVAFAADFLSIVVTEIGNIAERRLFRLNDGTLNRGLPDMLVASEHVGMDCGYMLPQYLAAALVSDCKTLAHPDSVDSIPTCSNQEDHVSMANNAGRHARQIVKNIENVVGIEVLMAAQALELRLKEQNKGRDILAPASNAVLAMLRDTATSDGRKVDHLSRDVVLYPRLEAATALVHSGAVLTAARKATGAAQ